MTHSRGKRPGTDSPALSTLEAGARIGLRASARAGVWGLKALAFGLNIAADLTPGVRLTKRRRLPRNLLYGILGAEVATWWAISPSLLPRPWWVTAANVAVSQAAGHGALTGLSYAAARLSRGVGVRPQRLIDVFSMQLAHLLLSAITVASGVAALRRQRRQAKLVGLSPRRGAREALIGGVLGTVGYGGFLLVGEGLQVGVDNLGRGFSRIMPTWVSWPLAAIALGALGAVASDRMVARRVISEMSRSAARLNRKVFPGTSMPWEPERSGSPWSLEPWSRVGAQGRAVLSLGPRAEDIVAATGLRREQVHEPIRIFVGLVPGRSLESAARLVLAEMDRTGAFRREVINIQTSAGTGWITDWSVCSVEFLSGGNCATVAMQYSYLPSAISYVVDRETPIRASRILIRAVLDRVAQMDPQDRPRVFVAGESLGAYGIADSFASFEDLAARVDGALLSGAPRFSRTIRQGINNRDAGSPERLPILGGGRQVRFASHPSHLRQDWTGMDYAHDWEYPRIVVAQHASDPIVWWERSLFYSRPDWLREPGSHGMRAPRTQFLDVPTEMSWRPFITGWQVALDQLTSLTVPGGHGHNYHAEMIWYWEAILGPCALFRLDRATASKIADFIQRDSVKR